MSFSSTGSTSLCSQDAAIPALREQIFANATALYPQLISRHHVCANYGKFDPKGLFEVITSYAGSSFKAILVSGPLLARTPVARGPEASCVTEALSALLKILSEAVGWYTDTLIGELENADKGEEGEVNMKLVEDGYHFAHVQRWAQKNNCARF